MTDYHTYSCFEFEVSEEEVPRIEAMFRRATALLTDDPVVQPVTAFDHAVDEHESWGWTYEVCRSNVMVSVVVSSQEDVNREAMVRGLQEFILDHRPPQKNHTDLPNVLSFTWAETCSPMSPGAFSGGGVVFDKCMSETAEVVKEMTASHRYFAAKNNPALSKWDPTSGDNRFSKIRNLLTPITILLDQLRNRDLVTVEEVRDAYKAMQGVVYNLAVVQTSAVPVYVRLSDNVLEESAWPVRKIMVTYDRGVVAYEDLFDKEKVAYDPSTLPSTGWTLEKLLAWTAVDHTGQHPETYHDVRAHGSEKWEYISRMADLRALIHRSQVAT